MCSTSQEIDILEFVKRCLLSTLYRDAQAFVYIYIAHFTSEKRQNTYIELESAKTEQNLSISGNWFIIFIIYATDA